MPAGALPHRLYLRRFVFTGYPAPGAEEGLNTILEATRNLDLVTAVGLPVRDKWDGKLYNCAALIQQGEILGLVPKVHLPNYGSFMRSGGSLPARIWTTRSLSAVRRCACPTV